MLNDTPIYDQLKDEQTTVTMTLLKDDPAVHALIYGPDTAAVRLGIKRTIEAGKARVEQWQRANPPIKPPTVRELQWSLYLAGQYSHQRRRRRTLFGIYRGHGDKPLIHKGRKP